MENSNSASDSLPQSALLRLETSQSCLTLSSPVFNTLLICCAIFSSGRGATTRSCSVRLHSNKICTVTWQAEKWLKCVNRLRGTSLYEAVFSKNLAATNLISSRSVLVLSWFLSVVSFVFLTTAVYHRRGRLKTRNHSRLIPEEDCSSQERLKVADQPGSI